MSEEKKKYKVKEAYIVDGKEGEVRKVILEVREVENHPPESVTGGLLDVILIVFLWFFIHGCLQACIWVAYEIEDWWIRNFY